MNSDDSDVRSTDSLVVSRQYEPLAVAQVGCCRCTFWRYLLAFLAFLGSVIIYSLRVNLSVALVAMVNQTAATGTSAYNESRECESGSTSSDSKRREGEMNWNSNEQGLVLAAFFYGYVTTQIPGGWLSKRVGGRLIYGLGVLITSVLTLLTPTAARWHVNALVALRIIEGIGEGIAIPAMHTLFADWAPPKERSSAVSFVFAGFQFGTVIGMFLSGLLCASDFAGGWPSAFYVFGIVGCAWSVLWFALCHDTPSVHPCIHPAERNYIVKTTVSSRHSTQEIPWRHILTSVPVWACATVTFANHWGFYTLLTCLPKYMNDVLDFDIAESGTASSLPYVACGIMTFAGGIAADRLRASTRLSTGAIRRIFCFAGLIFPGVLLIATGFLGCDHALIVAVLVLAVGISGVTHACFCVNQLDLAPAYAGALMGLTNMIGTIPGFLGPQVVGALTYHRSTRVEWQQIFCITAAVYGFGTLIYMIFGSGEIQPWAVTDSAYLIDELYEDSDTSERDLDED